MAPRRVHIGDNGGVSTAEPPEASIPDAPDELIVPEVDAAETIDASAESVGPAVETAVDAEPAPAEPDASPGEPDAILAAAIEPAREAAVATGAETVGAHLGARAESAFVVTHAFAATLPGYVGWYWAVSVTRAPELDEVTVDEVVLLPGQDALLAPAWVPWEQRVRPGDLSPGDLLPPPPGDIRLVPAYTLSDDPAVETVAFELGQGREQVMSRDGRIFAAERWYEGDRGPEAPMARQAPAHCGTCGFFLPLAGSLQAGFGVCGNEVTDCDGQVVSVEYGCGAHSSVRPEPTAHVDVAEVVYDDGEEIVADAAEQTADASN